MNVSLTPELEELVSQKVATGMYHSASEVIREALRLLRERDAFHQCQLEGLRKDISVGLQHLDEGRVTPLDQTAIDDVKARGRRRLARSRLPKR